MVDIREYRAETADRCCYGPISVGHEEQSLGDVAAHRSEQAKSAEGAEIGFVVRIVEEHCKTLWGSLRKAYPWCGELGAAGVQKRVERRYRGCRVGGTTNAVPVDLATTFSVERRWVIAVVGISQSSAERIDGVLNDLNRLGGWRGPLEHQRRNEVFACVALGVRNLPHWEQHR